MLDAKVQNPEVLVARESLVTIRRADIALMKRRARENARRQIRFCAHPTLDEKLHEMIIVKARGSYVRPHRHLDKPESFLVLEGKVDVLFFDEDGKVTKTVRMGDERSGKTFYYRIAEPLYHSLLVRSAFLVFHEATLGPFERAQTQFPPWAPAEDDTAGVAALMEKMDRAARKGGQ